jgi:hypothetical protein
MADSYERDQLFIHRRRERAGQNDCNWNLEIVSWLFCSMCSFREHQYRLLHTMVDSISTRVQLRGDVAVGHIPGSELTQAPQYVFGTGGIFKPEPIHHAMQEGYLAFDTAQMYGNEKEVGEAIRSYPGKIDRKDLFIITKVKEPQATVEETYQTIKDSVEKIGLGGYVDLFFVHNPNAGPGGRKIQWQALERALKEGLTRAIGVSN